MANYMGLATRLARPRIICFIFQHVIAFSASLVEELPQINHTPSFARLSPYKRKVISEEFIMN